jgi:hypothetical protein
VTRVDYGTERVFYRTPRGDVQNARPVTLDKYQKMMLEICRSVIHIRHVELPRFNVGDRLNNNLKLRVDYMRNKIGKDDFKKVLQKKEKENMKRGELSDIMGMYVSVMTDIMYRVLGCSESVDSVEMKEQKEMNTIRLYTNTLFETVSKTYHCKKYEIDSAFQFN